MRGRILILIGLIVLLFAIGVVVLIPNLSSDGNRVIVPPTSAANPINSSVSPSYEITELVFPEGTTDWKAVQNSTYSSLDNFYCEINNKWHRCYPVEVNK